MCPAFQHERTVMTCPFVYALVYVVIIAPTVLGLAFTDTLKILHDRF